MSLLRKNITFNFVGQAIVIPLSFISFKYIYSGLGDDALGIIYFSLMLSAIFSSALDMGLSKTTIREIAAHHLDEPEYVKKLIQTFSLFYWVAYISVTALFVYFLSEIVDSWINLTTMEGELAYNVLMVLGITSLLAIPKLLLTSVCVGLQRMDITNSIEVVLAVLQQIGVILLLIEGNNFIVVAYWIAAVNITNVLIYMLFVSRLLSIKVMLPLFSTTVVNRVKKYTSKMMLVSLLLVIHKQLDKVLLSKLLPIGLMGVYSFAYASITRTSLITGAVAQAVFPSFSELDRREQKKKLLERYFAFQDLLVFGTIPIFVLVVFFMTPLFTYLLDETKAEMLRYPVLLLCIAFYLNATMRMVSTYVSAIGKPEYIVSVTKFLLFTSLPITVILVVMFGILGASISWVVYQVLAVIHMVPQVYKNELKQSPHIWYRSVRNAVISVCAIYLPLWYMVEWWFSGDVLYLLLFYMLGTVAYGVIALNLVSDGLRGTVLNFIPVTRILLITRKKD